MKWFKHDSTAYHDAKLAKVRLKYGMEGYGLYWFCLELIAKNVETHNLTFELEEDAELLSVYSGIHYERVQEMMTYMANLGLFENCEGRITCLKMATRTDEYTQQLMRKASTIPTNSRECPDKVRGIRIDKNRTDKKIIKEIRTTTRPTVDEVAEYVSTRAIQINPQSFVDYYTANGWKVGRHSMKDWKAAVRTWEKNENGKTASRAGRQSIETIYVD
jgi:hypothetical protein